MKIFGEDYDIKESNCPACGVPLNAAGSFANKEEVHPSEGDWSLCFYCGSALRFTEGNAMRLATQDELEEFKSQAAEKFFIFAQAQKIIRTLAALKKASEN